MFAAIAHFGPVLAAEKSKVPYYIAGGLLVAWALFLSVGLGRRNPNFPGSLGGQRAVMAIIGRARAGDGLDGGRHLRRLERQGDDRADHPDRPRSRLRLGHFFA